MIGIYYKEGDSRSIDCMKKLEVLFAQKSIETIILTDKTPKSFLKKIKLIIVCGGDGSVLRASKYAKELIPIVAINTGNVGFLSSYEVGNLDGLVNDILNDNLVFSKRKFMSITFNDKEFFALNDAVITKNHKIDTVSECVKMSLKIDGQFVDTYVGDGLILSTPLGSTAYAISAGGPIVVPNINAYVAAPICAHSLHSRPIVFSQDSLAEIVIRTDSKECALFIDGKMEASLKPNSVVKIKASEKFASICDNSGKFFSRLSEKLNKWSNNDLLEVDHG